MKTKEVYKLIDLKFSEILKKNNLCYSLRKIKNQWRWRTQIGKFNKITDSYIQGEIYVPDWLDPDYLEDFQEILSVAIRTLSRQRNN